MKIRHFLAIAVLAAVLAGTVAYLSDQPKETFAAGVDVRQQGRIVSFSLHLINPSGKKISPAQLPGGAPRSPKVKVLDDQGKQVYICTMEYG